jgi:hypothetical protein
MRFHSAILAMFRDRRFWLWQIAGAVIYLIPVSIRFATKSVAIPILNFPGFWIGHFIPGNLLEKLLVNAFFPGGAGGVAGEIFFDSYRGVEAKGKTKYLHRLAGAFVWTAAWSVFQFIGYSLSVMGPYGSNLFEYVGVFPINFVLAAVSIFTPDVVGFVKSKIMKTRGSVKISQLD